MRRAAFTLALALPSWRIAMLLVAVPVLRERTVAGIVLIALALASWPAGIGVGAALFRKRPARKRPA